MRTWKNLDSLKNKNVPPLLASFKMYEYKIFNAKPV